MKTFASLLTFALSGFALAAAPADSGAAPCGIAASDWSGIRTAYEAGRHAPHRQEDGHLLARNPGQQWRSEFDGRGFTVTPDHAAWTWGLELTGYGDRTLSSLDSSSQLRQEGAKITCQRDENLTEWFVNDTRGLEQGWDIRQRPDRAGAASPLKLQLATRGDVRPQVSAEGDAVSFQAGNGVSALTYGSLKAIDADGKSLPVHFEQSGANGLCVAVDDQNARYPVTIDPIAQQARLKASNPDADDRFGGSVAISGDTIAVSASAEDSAATGVNGDQTNNGAKDSGAVYIFVRTGTTWTQQAYLKASNTDAGDAFGSALAISGDTVVVASRFEASAALYVGGDQTNNAAPYAGAVYVFTRTGTAWSQQAYIKASNTEAHDFFGSSVAVDGDTLVVGATGESSSATGLNSDQTSNAAPSSGAVYVFARTGQYWIEQAYLKASNTQAYYYFGSSVGISGDTLVVGSSGEGSKSSGVNGDESYYFPSAGAAYVFIRTGTNWYQQAYLKSDGPFYNAYFGSSVAISGDTVVVGSYGDGSDAIGVNGPQTNIDYDNSGAAFVFVRTGTTWAQQARFKASNRESNDQFGVAVAISGDTVIVSATGEDSAATGVNGDQANNAATNSGAAYVFTRSGVTWTQQAYLKADNVAPGAYLFSVAVSGSTAVVGSFSHDAVSDAGATVAGAGVAYIFNLNPAILSPTLVVQQTGATVANGDTQPFGNLAAGDASDLSFDVSNTGSGDLVIAGITITGDSAFTVVEQPSGPIAASGGSATFKVRLSTSSAGSKSALLSISSNDGNNTPFLIRLTGMVLSYTTDTDGDGLSDAQEVKLAALGFDWQVKQTDMVNAYLANANRSGLYVPAQVHAIRVAAPSIAKDTASGQFRLTAHWQISANLIDFYDLPAPAGSSVSINAGGGIDFEFPSPDDAAFLRVEHD